MPLERAIRFPDTPPAITDFRTPLLLKNAHLNTIYGGRLRPVSRPDYRRERIDTPDGDFLDIDWSPAAPGNRAATRHASSNGTQRPGPAAYEPADTPDCLVNRRAAVISHGMEGSSDRTYVRSVTNALNKAGWDVAAWNFRGCSGPLNRLVRSYHSGATEDVDTVVRHVAARGYRTIALVGFSLGGNLILKYLGETDRQPQPIAAAVAISVPCDLEASATRLERLENWIYKYRFLRSLREKYRKKSARFPEVLNPEASIDSIRDFDEVYTAPVHGFSSVEDYWNKCSCSRFIPDIDAPTLILNAADDPFLSPSCYPKEEASSNPNVLLQIPTFGGHIGFSGHHGNLADLATVRWLEACTTAARETVE